MLRKLTLLTLVLSLPALAAAQYDPRHPHRAEYGPAYSGLTLSASLGFGVPTGRISREGDGDLGDKVGASLPLGIGASYRFTPTFRLGGLLELAPVSVTDRACPSGRDCSGTSLRFLAEGQVHLSPHRHVDPWIGFGVGYESLALQADYYDPYYDTTYYSELKYSGFIFPRLSAGLDVAVSPRFTLGPYAAYTAGQYGGFETDHDSGGIHRTAFHGWLELGVRGSFNL